MALGCKIKEENFLKDSNVLSDLKLRLGWGITGQQNVNSDFGYAPLYVIGNEYVQYPFGSEYYYSSRPNAFNKDLKWEKTTTYNAGLDFGFLNGRITGAIDGYYRETKDLLNSVKIPVGTNFNSQLLSNIGSLENYGVEFSLTGTPVVTDNFTWNLSYNVTWNHNEITKYIQELKFDNSFLSFSFRYYNFANFPTDYNQNKNMFFYAFSVLILLILCFEIFNRIPTIAKDTIIDVPP